MTVHLPPAHDRDAWQVAIWNADDAVLSRPQKLELMHVLEAAFNCFDPFAVVRDLLARRDLWAGVVMCRGYPMKGLAAPDHWTFHSDLINLRDVAGGHWNVDTLYILHPKANGPALEQLAGNWRADEVDQLEDDAIGPTLGCYGCESGVGVLRVWWD